MRINHFTLLVLFAVALGFASCVSQKKLSYLRHVTEQSADTINKTFKDVREATIKCNDALTITVNALDAEAAMVFNLPLAANPTSMLSNNITTVGSLQYYTVDKDGNINFPVLGLVHLEGMTTTEARDFLTQEISKSIKDPIVNIHFLNYHVTVLGEVNSPGVYTVNNGERFTVLDALGMARDLTIYGKRNNVLICRENNGKMEYARLNLNDASIFASPFYFLQQNDIVYVEPNNARGLASQNITVYLSMVTSLASVTSVIVSTVSMAETQKRYAAQSK